MNSRAALSFFSLAFLMLASCSDPTENPHDAFNAFLKAVDKEDCERAFALFSSASQEKIREGAARASKDYPSYSPQFTPEKYYCTSVFANRFHEYNRGSAKTEKIDGTNAIVIAMVRKSKGFGLPGFSPFFWKNVPSEMRMVKENGAWKINLITPISVVANASALREKKLAEEMKRVEELIRRKPEKIHPGCTNFQLIARWTFQNEPIEGKIQDETGSFSAEILGAHIIDVPEGKALQFQAEKEAVRLPEALLNYRACGVIVFSFRRDDEQSLNRVLLKVFPGVFSETGIEVHSDGKIHFNVQKNGISSNARLEPHKFYQLAFVWGENGLRIFVDGQLDATMEKASHIAATSSFTELGRDPNNQDKTGSRMTIRDLRIYEGLADEATLAQLFSAK